MARKARIKVKNLSKAEFPNGALYFEHGHREFRGENIPCEKCVFVHNNCIVSNDAKVYRFKETGFWEVNTNNYYSDKYQKHLVFDNPIVLETDMDTKKQEKESLLSGLYLSYLLNRTLLLPRFHCNTNNKHQCSLSTSCHISTFNRYVGNQYRESSFMLHELVPDSVKSSKSPTILIGIHVAKHPELKDVFLGVDIRLTLLNLDMEPSRPEMH